MFQTQAALLGTFHGGITDKFIDAAPNRYERGDNLLISIPNLKLFTRGGSILYSSDKPQLPTGNQRVGRFIDFNEVLLANSSTNIYWDDGVNWTELLTVASKSIFTVGDADTIISFDTWNNQLFLTNEDFSKPIKLYKDNVGDFKAHTAGMPAISAPNVAGTAGANNYIYAFYYQYTFNVGDRQYIDAGAVTQVQVLNIDTPDVNQVDITSITELVNAAEDSYDVSNVKIRIYRTQANGTTLYFLTELNNGTTSYIDTAADSSIINNTTIYTTGGVLSNDAPPLCKYIHINNNVAYYAHIKEGSSTFGNRVRLSVVNDPDSVPTSNFIDIDQDITGVSSFMDRTILFTKNGTYRVDGNFDTFGGGIVTYQKISDTIGCISSQSIVQTPNGVLFADEDGFAFTDGFLVYHINDQWSERYKSAVINDQQKGRIQGAYDKEGRRVHWSVQTNEVGDCDKQYILDTNFEISTESAFTTMSGGERDIDNFSSTASIFMGGKLIRGDKRGFIFKHDKEYLTDPLVDLSKLPENWDTTAIIYDFKSIASSFGDTKFRKIIPRMNIQMENVSNISLEISSISDLKKTRTLQPVRFRGNWVWGDPLFAWREPTFKWRGTGFIAAQRRFDSDDLRCTYKQLKLTNSKTIIVNSDSLGTGTTNTTLKTITLDDAASFNWPQNIGTYSIVFENDGYEKEFSIVSRSDDTLVLSDTGNELPSGSGLKWHMVGYAKDEVLSLLNITVLYALLGQTQPYFDPTSLGKNA